MYIPGKQVHDCGKFIYFSIKGDADYARDSLCPIHRFVPTKNFETPTPLYDG